MNSCAFNTVKHCVCVTAFNPLKDSMKSILLLPPFEKWGVEGQKD